MSGSLAIAQEASFPCLQACKESQVHQFAIKFPVVMVTTLTITAQALACIELKALSKSVPKNRAGCNELRNPLCT